MIELKSQKHSHKPPEYIDSTNQTEFLENFCREQDVEILSVIGEAFEFINYKVSFNRSHQYTLLHQLQEIEEHIYLNYIDYYNG